MRQAKSSIAAGLSPLALTNFLPDEVRPMYHQHHLSTTGQPAVAATRRRWSRRMLVALAASVLGLLPGIPSLTPTGSAVVQAAQRDQPHPAAPTGGLAGADPTTNAEPKDYPPNLIVQS